VTRYIANELKEYRESQTLSQHMFNFLSVLTSKVVGLYNFSEFEKLYQSVNVFSVPNDVHGVYHVHNVGTGTAQEACCRWR